MIEPSPIKVKKRKKEWQPKPILFKEIECRASEIKAHIDQFRSDGFVLDHLEFEPSVYKYKLFYYPTSKTLNGQAEEWRDLPGDLSGEYQISSLGRLRTIKVKVVSEHRGVTQVITNKGDRITVNKNKLFKQMFPELC